MNLLLGRGLGVSDRFVKPGVAGFSGMVLVALLVVGFLVGEVGGGTDGSWDSSPLVRGKGNSRAGGMGRMFVPPSSAEEEAAIVMTVLRA